MTLLDGEQIRQKLSGLPGWSREGDAIVKQYELADFVSAIAFVRRVAERAEDAGHHPDIAINYNKVTLTLSTHSEGGITQKDIDAAGSFEEALEA